MKTTKQTEEKCNRYVLYFHRGGYSDIYNWSSLELSKQTAEEFIKRGRKDGFYKVVLIDTQNSTFIINWSCD